MIFRMIATLFVAVVFQNAYPAFLFADDNTSPNNVWAKLSAKKSHPRYLLTDSKVKQLRDHYEDEAKKADNTHSVDFRWYKRMRVHASRIADILEGVPADKLDQPASWAKAEYDANLNTGYYDFNFTMSQKGANVNPKQVVNVVRILAFTYLIESGSKNTNTRKYSDSVWKVIKRLEAGLTDAEWNKMQDLDRSDCITAAAIAFDWCHDTELKQMPKQRVANFIWNRGIIPFHQKVVADSIEDWDQYKPSNNSNWTHWAYTGVLAGVIVVDGVDGERKREQLLKKSVEYLKVFRKIYEDWEGGWLEGTSYAETSASGLARIYGGLESSTGIDFGSDYDTKWVRRFSNFIPHLTGPDRLWTFGDSTDWTTDSPAMLWFASVFNDKQLQRYAIDRIVRMGDFLPMPEHLIWYREMSGLPESFDKKYSMQYLDVAVMKSDNGKTFFAAKGNRSGRHVQVGAGHYHLDAGDFRFETQVFDLLTICPG